MPRPRQRSQYQYSDIQCISCDQLFATSGGLSSHLEQKASCQWVLRERLNAPCPPAPDLGDFDTTAADPDLMQEDSPFIVTFHEDTAPTPHPAADDRRARVEDHPDNDEPSNRANPDHRAVTEQLLTDDIVIDAYEGAGTVIGRDGKAESLYTKLKAADNPYHPFTSRLDWEVAKWAKESKTGDTKLTNLLNIDGVVERLGLSYSNARALNQMINHDLPARADWQTSPIKLAGSEQSYELFHRDILECIRALYGNVAFSGRMAYQPEKHYPDEERTQRIYSEMHTGDWWHETQAKLPSGSTVVPVIFATDKTQVSMFSGDKTAYPLYMMIGNIDKSTQRKPSYYGWILVAYLPTEKLDKIGLSEVEARIARARLFHACMGHIVKPLVEAGESGIAMMSGDGAIRCCHPIVAAYVADHPEQSLVTCTRTGSGCPICPAKKTESGSHVCHSPRDSKKTSQMLSWAATQPSLARADKVLKDAGLTFVDRPFWAELPHSNIHQAITPDILHQGYQGVLKHLVSWLQHIVGEAELDARFQRLPPMHGLCSFRDGISGLTRISGREHKEICKQILGCIIGKAPAAAVRASVALLDFFYIAQYQSHSDTTLEYLTEALDEFHADKQVFINLGARDVDGADTMTSSIDVWMQSGRVRCIIL